jgi:hypothetical protein
MSTHDVWCSESGSSANGRFGRFSCASRWSPALNPEPSGRRVRLPNPKIQSLSPEDAR